MENGISGQLRTVISLVDKLRDINLQSYIQLPKIVVVGSQSSGKSSLIQQIVGIDFLPRGSGVVTRRPLQIRMIYQHTLQKPYAEFQQIPGKKFDNFSKVKQAIEELTDKICGKNKNIIDKAIILNVHSKSCPNLTLIDLPGLTRIAIEGQSQDIYKVTAQMIKKYMRDPTSIILCVIPANQDITNDEVLHEAMKIDSLGQRTIGCITKIDIMDRGTDARLVLQNKGEVPLRLGYVGIKNRSQADIKQNKTVLQSIQQQKMFFSKSPIYSSLPPNCLGTNALITSLTKVLETNIIQFLPDLMFQIKQRKNNLHDLIKQFGRPLPKNDEQSQALLWSICDSFLQQFKKTMKGHLSQLKCRALLTKNSSYINDLLTEVLSQENNQLLAQNLTSHNIHLAIIKYQGNNMPGFPSINSFYSLIDPLLKKLKFPLLHCLQEVCRIFFQIAAQIMSEVARQFPNFKDHILDRINLIVEKQKKKSEDYIHNIIQSQIGYLYMNNDQFYQQLQEQNIIYNDPKDQLNRKYPIISVLKKRVNIYYKIIVKNLREIIPRNIKYIVFNKIVGRIQFQIFQACIGEKDKIKQWLKFNTRQIEERRKKQKQYQIVSKAEQFLHTHPAFSRIRVADIQKKKKQRQLQLKKIQEEKNKKMKEEQPKLRPKTKDTIEQSPIQKQKKPEIPRESDKKPVYQTKQHLKPQEKTISKANQISKPIGPSTTKQPQRGNFMANLFGLGTKTESTTVKKPQPVITNKDQKVTDIYNQKAGQATDKAVDQMFKNQTFKKQSTKAVQKGASTAVQKQFGTSQQTSNFFGKAAGLVFKQDATQNYLKDQTKANVKDQIQIKK